MVACACHCDVEADNSAGCVMSYGEVLATRAVVEGAKRLMSLACFACWVPGWFSGILE